MTAAPHCRQLDPFGDLPQFDPLCRDPSCRVCEGSGTVRYLKFRGRFCSRLEIARWFIEDRIWKGAQVVASRSIPGSIYLRKGSAIMRLDGLTADEILTLIP